MHPTRATTDGGLVDFEYAWVYGNQEEQPEDRIRVR